jgi:hypothetical protein
MLDRSSKRSRDPNDLAKLVVYIATGEAEGTMDSNGKNAAAVELGA